jgi:hypothetical protein
MASVGKMGIGIAPLFKAEGTLDHEDQHGLVRSGIHDRKHVQRADVDFPQPDRSRRRL